MKQCNELVPFLKEMFFRFGGEYKEFNLFGFRDPSGTMSDVFNDILGYTRGDECFIDWGTTDPGKSGILNPVTVGGITGAAFLKPGLHKGMWKVGEHGIHNPSFKHKAWVQVGAVEIYRDRNKNGVIDSADILTRGVYGINRHRASKAKLAEFIGPYSIGCQVYQSASSLEQELNAFESTDMFKANNAVSVDYLLAEMNEIAFDVKAFLKGEI